MSILKFDGGPVGWASRLHELIKRRWQKMPKPVSSERKDSTTTPSKSTPAQLMQLIGGICLFPTVMDLVKSPTGSSLAVQLLIRIPGLPFILQTVCRMLLGWWNLQLLTLLVSRLAGMPRYPAAYVTAAFLQSEMGVFSALYLVSPVDEAAGFHVHHFSLGTFANHYPLAGTRPKTNSAKSQPTNGPPSSGALKKPKLSARLPPQHPPPYDERAPRCPFLKSISSGGLTLPRVGRLLWLRRGGWLIDLMDVRPVSGGRSNTMALGVEVALPRCLIQMGGRARSGFSSTGVLMIVSPHIPTPTCSLN